MEKNLELGINFSKKMGQNEFIGYFPDSFGHSREITKLCKKFGIDKIILWRGASNISSDFLMDDIKITRLPQGYFFDALHSNLNYSKKAEIVEMSRLVKQAIAKLPQKERTVVEYRFYRNMQAKDIATVITATITSKTNHHLR